MIIVLETSRDNYYNPEMIFSVKRVRYDRIDKMIFISWITPFLSFSLFSDNKDQWGTLCCKISLSSIQYINCYPHFCDFKAPFLLGSIFIITHSFSYESYSSQVIMVLETSRDNYYNPEMIFSVKRVRYDRINKMIFISWITPFL